MSEQPACHDLLIVLRYAMKSRAIYLYWLSRRNIIYLFIVIFILCCSCSPSKYGHALNCQNLYIEMGSKDTLLDLLFHSKSNGMRNMLKFQL